MNIDIQYIHMPSSESLNGIVIKKMKKLIDKYEWIVKSRVIFKMENEPSGKAKICEIELSVPGPRIFAKSKEANFEKAAASTIEELETQLKKRKQKFVRY